VRRREALVIVSFIVHCLRLAMNHTTQRGIIIAINKPTGTAIPTIAPVDRLKAPPLPPDAPAGAPDCTEPTPPGISPVPSVSVIVGKDDKLDLVGVFVVLVGAAIAVYDANMRVVNSLKSR